MNRKSCLAVILLCLLLVFPLVSVKGASDGLLLWFHVVLPTLSPFIICTQAIVALHAVELIMRPVYPLFKRMFHLSMPGAYVLLCGLLCGYPLGARLCAQFLESGRITEREAKQLLAICNHPSPMFLLGYVRNQIPFFVSPILLLLCMYLPILPLSVIAGRVYRKDKEPRNKSAGDNVSSLSEVTVQQGAPVSLEKIIHSTCETMVLIGAYMMLFSILAAWINACPFFSDTVKAVCVAVTEITVGVHSLCIFLPRSLVLPAVLACVSFGGLSGIFQTKSVIRCETKNAGLNVRHYVLWKILHAALACAVFAALTALFGALPR